YNYAIFLFVHSCDNLIDVIYLIYFVFTTNKIDKSGMKMSVGFYLLKKRKEQEYFETKSKIPSPKQVQELNNLQDLNTQSFDCHDQQYQSQLIIW
ncbi:hypothetical protein Avbf_13471, partial [Armadillidium vulgare]